MSQEASYILLPQDPYEGRHYEHLFDEVLDS